MASSSGSGQILILDNFDSFTYNLVHQVEKFLNGNVVVKRNNEPLDSLDGFDGIILSPGPGLPEEAGNLMEVVKDSVSQKKKVLGVCLGHQAINNFFGGSLLNMGVVHHGIELPVMPAGNDVLFRGLEESFSAARYHSWMCNPVDFPDVLSATAFGPGKEIMALRHKSLPVFGVQFHPESILTPAGDQIIQNWLKFSVCI